MSSAPVGEEEFELSKAQAKDGKTLTLIATLASSVTMEKMEWLWPDRIPGGKITWFSGKPDCGKSLALVDLVARVTTGADWPDGQKNALGPKNVIMAVSEDDLGSTLVPRLKAAGADLTRVNILVRVEIVKADKSGKRQLQLSEDAKLLKFTLRKNPDVALVALDPITGYFGDADPNKDKEIRPVMEALQQALEVSKAAFVAVVHHNKKSDVDPIGKILGASSVTAVSRAAWGFTRDPDNKEEYYMALVKSNLSKKRTGMKYKIAEATVLINGEECGVPHTEWLGETDLDAAEVMDKERDKAGNAENKKVDVASLLLKSELESGPKLARDMYKKVKAEGISERTLKRASYDLGVIVTQVNKAWYWRLPKSGEAESLAHGKEIFDQKIGDGEM